MVINLAALCITPESTIRQAISCIDENSEGIALVVDSQRHLLGTVTDGDIRRALLAQIGMDLPVQTLLDNRRPHNFGPLTAPMGTGDSELVTMMREHKLRHIPLLDLEGRVADLALLSNMFKDAEAPPRAVIMAGGFGTRLRPLTDDLPKPMLPVGDRPIMELIVNQLRDAGIKHVNVTLHHQPEKITEHFGDGRQFGLDITYVEEGQPMGTAGGLTLIEPPQETLLVINGDILTQLDIQAMVAYHREQESDLTLAVQQYEMRVPYGVVECDEESVTGLTEKPVITFLISAGIYLLEPSVYSYLRSGERRDMTELIQDLIRADRKVTPFLVREYWLDIGQDAEYKRAGQDVQNWNST